MSATANLPIMADFIANFPGLSLNLSDYLTTTCGICWTEFVTDPAYVIKLPCGHIFHEACCLEWFNSTNENRNTCAECRAPLFQFNALTSAQEAAIRAYNQQYNEEMSPFDTDAYSWLLTQTDVLYEREMSKVHGRPDCVSIIHDARVYWETQHGSEAAICQEHAEIGSSWIELVAANRVLEKLVGGSGVYFDVGDEEGQYEEDEEWEQLTEGEMADDEEEYEEWYEEDYEDSAEGDDTYDDEENSHPLCHGNSDEGDEGGEDDDDWDSAYADPQTFAILVYSCNSNRGHAHNSEDAGDADIGAALYPGASASGGAPSAQQLPSAPPAQDAMTQLSPMSPSEPYEPFNRDTSFSSEDELFPSNFAHTALPNDTNPGRPRRSAMPIRTPRRSHPGHDPISASARDLTRRTLIRMREQIESDGGTIICELRNVASTTYNGDGSYTVKDSERRTMAVIRDADAYHEVTGHVMFYQFGA